MMSCNDPPKIASALARYHLHEYLHQKDWPCRSPNSPRPRWVAKSASYDSLIFVVEKVRSAGRMRAFATINPCFTKKNWKHHASRLSTKSPSSKQGEFDWASDFGSGRNSGFKRNTRSCDQFGNHFAQSYLKKALNIKHLLQYKPLKSGNYKSCGNGCSAGHQMFENIRCCQGKNRIGWFDWYEEKHATWGFVYNSGVSNAWFALWICKAKREDRKWLRGW